MERLINTKHDNKNSVKEKKTDKHALQCLANNKRRTAPFYTAASDCLWCVVSLIISRIVRVTKGHYESSSVAPCTRVCVLWEDDRNLARFSESTDGGVCRICCVLGAHADRTPPVGSRGSTKLNPGHSQDKFISLAFSRRTSEYISI